MGDTVTTRRNDPTLHATAGAGVRNRHTWTVTRVHRGGALTVTHPDRGTVTLPAAYVAGAVELGWAVTGYGNQGTTVDHGIAIIEPAATRAGIYVAMTRGRHRNTAWIPDPTGTLDPQQALADATATPGRALSAHAIHQQLHGPAIEPEALEPRRRGRELSL